MTSKYEATGTVHFIGPSETRGKFTFRKFVVKTDADTKWPQTVEFQATRGEIETLDKIHVGDEIAIKFDIRGREWTGKDGVVKYFNSLDAWEIQLIKQSPVTKADLDGSDIPF